MEIYTKAEVDEQTAKLWDLVNQLQRDLTEIRQQRTIWIDQEQAETLTGRSRTWFYEQRTAGTLPIAMLPRTEGSRRLKYSEADCIAYGQQHRILPPPTAPCYESHRQAAH